MKFSAQQLLLYAVTDRGDADLPTLLEQVEAALRGGVTMVQLREKTLHADAYIAEAKALLPLCHRYGVPLLIDDDLDVALQSGADGLHVGADDLPVQTVRARVGRDFILGATAKTVAQAKAAERDGADYLGVGAVFPSPTKQNAIRITRDELREICAAVSIPAVAIGGINAANVAQLRAGGMRGVAVVSALFSAPDIAAAAADLRARVEAVLA